MLDALQVRLKVALTARLKALIELVLLCQPLHDTDGSQGLLGQSRHQAGALASLAGSELDTACVSKDGPEQQRGYRQRGQSEPPVNRKHHYQHGEIGRASCRERV